MHRHLLRSLFAALLLFCVTSAWSAPAELLSLLVRAQGATKTALLVERAQLLIKADKINDALPILDELVLAKRGEGTIDAIAFASELERKVNQLRLENLRERLVLRHFLERDHHTVRHLSLLFRHNQRSRVRRLLQRVHGKPCVPLADTRVAVPEQYLHIIKRAPTGNYEVSKLMPARMDTHLFNTCRLPQSIPDTRNCGEGLFRFRVGKDGVKPFHLCRFSQNPQRTLVERHGT